MKIFRSLDYRAAAVVGFGLLSLLCAGGCSTTAGLEASGKTTWSDEGARELSKKVVFNSIALSSDVKVVDIKSERSGDLMRAQVTLASKDRDTVSLQYRFAWFDAGGMEINAASGSWKPLILYGKETRSVQGVAPDPRAKEFMLKLREADK